MDDTDGGDADRDGADGSDGSDGRDDGGGHGRHDGGGHGRHDGGDDADGRDGAGGHRTFAMEELASPERAREAVRSLSLSAGTDTVELSAADGRVLAERVEAEMDIPGFDRSALDGYAVRAADTDGADEDPVALRVVGEVHAGERPDVALDEGEAAGISTGAVMPPGADAMVPVERVDREGDRLRVHAAVGPGGNVSPAGYDLAAGQRVFGPGTVLSPREVGTLAALGRETVPVIGRPTVGIVSTGAELVPVGDSLDHRRGQIHDVNAPAVAAAVRAAGGDPRVYDHAGDDYDELEATLRAAAADCELVVSSGSTSAGALDAVYRVVEDRGEVLVHGVAVKPGKPLLVGRMDGSAYVGLPGYPVSALSTFRTFLAPAIREAAGLPPGTADRRRARMAVAETFGEARHRLVPVALVEPGAEEPLPGDGAGDASDGPGADPDPPGRLLTGGPADGDPDDLLAYPVDRGSGATASLSRADGLVEMPAGVERLPAGRPVTVELLSGPLQVPTLLGAGEDDPALSVLLDDCERPRYLPVGTRGGLERLRAGVPDVAVAAGPDGAVVGGGDGGDAGGGNGPGDGGDGGHDHGHGHDGGESGDGPGTGTGDGDGEDGPEPVTLGGWHREWGLVVPAGNPESVAGVADLLDRELRLVNRTPDSGLRTSLAGAVAALADRRGIDRHAAVDSIAGFGGGVEAHGSPPRRVADGRADVGLGLRATAEDLGLGFVSLGDQRVRVLASGYRTGKPGVERFRRVLSERLPAVLSDLPGYRE